LAKSGIVVGGFAEIGEGRFGDDRFDARIGSGGLQGDAPAHGFPEGEDMFRPRTGRAAGAVPLDRKTGTPKRREQRVHDGAGVVAFEPAVGGDRAFAGAVGAGVHHDDAIAGAQEKFGLPDDADAVVGHAMEEQHPGTVGLGRSDLPAAEENAVGGPNVEFLALRAGDGEGSVRFADEIGREFSADGCEEAGRDQPAPDRRQKRREEQQDQGDADQLSTHKSVHPGSAGRGCLHSKIRVERTGCSPLQRTGTAFGDPWERRKAPCAGSNLRRLRRAAQGCETGRKSKVESGRAGISARGCAGCRAPR